MEISEQVAAAQELVSQAQSLHKAEEELYMLKTVFQAVSSGITIADAKLPDRPLIYVNPAFERITGYSAAEVLGRNCRFLQGAETDQQGVAEVRAAIRHAQEVRVLLHNFRKDGRAFWNELYLSPIYDLKGRLCRFVGVQNDVTALTESTQRLEFLAHHDVLTGLYNRRQLMLRLTQNLAAARRTGHLVAVLFFDLNGFKQVNDVLGHEAGDDLLKTVADRMRQAVREAETLARLGGDEFVVVLDQATSPREALEAMSRLERALREPTELVGKMVTPSASVGVALFPEDGETPDDLLRVADKRMYLAKQERRYSGRAEQGWDGRSRPEVYPSAQLSL